MVLALHADPGRAQPFSGSLTCPRQFQTADGISFSHIEGPPRTEPVVASAMIGDAVSLTLQKPDDPNDRDTFLLRVVDEADAALQIPGAPLPPMHLVRAEGPLTVATDWESGRTYSVYDEAPSNPAMQSIFAADQKAREAGPLHIDWAVVSKADAQRRQETRALLTSDALHSGDDFAWAAGIFQHGETPDDYLLAHTLAMIAVSRGNSGALWIACATMDRYLQSIKQPQIYGTQFNTPDGKLATQQPYNPAMISDELRRLLGVPDLAEQQKQRAQYDAGRLPAR